MNQVEQSVAEYVDEVWEDVVADIEQLVSYPSVAVSADAEPGAPFGRPVRDALDCALGIAQKLGYQTSDDEGYVGIADIPGRGDKQLATICHVDMVPAGPGWNTDPFALERREGWLLGRGVIDDKGPAVLSLYAGAYLLKHGITPRYTFRALLGCDEEVGMSDVHHYLENHADPDFLFYARCRVSGLQCREGPVWGDVVSPKDRRRAPSCRGAAPRRAMPFRRSPSASSRLPPMSCRRPLRTPTAWRSRRLITGMRRFSPTVLAATLRCLRAPSTPSASS